MGNLFIMEDAYHHKLKKLMDKYVHEVYRVTSGFPKGELYGLTSQFRRASLSVILNYIEGYSRFKDKVHKNFLETSFGSLKESKYLAEFSYKEKLMGESEYSSLDAMADEIAAMLYGMLRNM
jgi:four helix bundle protein